MGRSGYSGYVLMIGLIFIGAAAATDNVSGNWRSHMQVLSSTLTDGFPFFYSRSEFRSPKNQERILKRIERLSAAAHDLPAASGKSLIGAEPLIESLQVDIKTDLSKAAELYKGQDFDGAQVLLHASIQKCFACHTAHQVGPQFPKSNGEIAGMATPFAQAKPVVFGALRQFDGAMSWIEKEGFVSINKANPQEDDLVKLHMIVALRAVQNFDRATKLIDRLKKGLPAESPALAALNKWSKDIKAWQGAGGSDKALVDYVSANRSANSDENLIVNLMDSLVAHRQLASTVSAKAELYSRLGDDYSAMNLGALGGLPQVYFSACAKADPGGKTGAACAARTAK